ncbi:MAG: carbon storage regulator [Bryobacterales bacterium]|jgi:carbon storage regulator|nr:carbon storage regulator [Bryobacterales bacterium]
MLITRRREGEAIVIDGSIEVRVLEIAQGRVKLGISAPGNVPVERKELRLVSNQNQAAMLTAQSAFAKRLLQPPE